MTRKQPFRQEPALARRWARSDATTSFGDARHADITVQPDQDLDVTALLDAVPDALLGVDRAGVIRLVNHQTELLFGYDRDDLVGLPIEALVPESVRAVHKVHRERYVAAPFTRTMGTDLELRGRRRDDTQFPVDIALSHTDSDDGPLVIAAVRDLTDQVVERLAELERFQRLTVERELKMIELKTEIGYLKKEIEDLTKLGPAERDNFDGLG